MLKRFSVRGYRNFKDTLTFDLSKRGKYDFQTDLIQSGIVNKGIIYGKNGSGKSNLGRAIFDIERNLMVNSQLNYFCVDSNPTYQCLDSMEDVWFSYTFIFGKDELVYEYTKKQMFYVTSEKVYINGTLMLDYCGDKSKVKSLFPGTDSLSFSTMNDGLSTLLFLYRTYEFPKESPISKLFDFVSGMLWFRCLNQGNAEDIEARIIEENKLKDFEKYLSMAGLNYHLVEQTFINASNGKMIKRICAKFKKGTVPLGGVLSTGTQALELFYYWSLRFSKHSFIFIDEFDAFYHYELSAAIIRQLNAGTGFQSFVTTHNTSLMNNELMRPDCLFLIGNNKIKDLSECTEKDLREGHNLEKIYRNEGFHV